MKNTALFIRCLSHDLMALFARCMLLLACLLGPGEDPHAIVDEVRDEHGAAIHGEGHHVDAGHANTTHNDGGHTQTQTGPVRGRLGLAGRGRGVGFIVGRGQRDGAVHANRGRASLGLTRRAHATTSRQEDVHHEPHAEGSSDAQTEGPRVGHAAQDEREIRRRNTYSNEVKQSIYGMLLERTSVGKLNKGVSKAVSLETGVPWRVVQRIWYDAKKGGGVNGVVSKKPKNSGPKKKPFDPDRIKSIALENRTTFKDLAIHLNMSKSTVHRRFKEGEFRRHTNAIKPTLNEENKKARVLYA
ncbi:hypothetical protein BS78_01G343500 [Paspalum vaginatum]|nr:hypothetical protein BS78_01G343500 [Paspalum vaginatum]